MSHLKTSDLRLGNMVLRRYWNPEPGNEHYAWDTAVIDVIKQDNVNLKLRADCIIAKVSIMDIKPVPITVERLLRFGFTGDENDLRIGLPNGDGVDLSIEYASGSTCVVRNEVKVLGKVHLKEHFVYIRHLDYMHQLQNCFFALCGEELQLDHHINTPSD